MWVCNDHVEHRPWRLGKAFLLSRYFSSGVLPIGFVALSLHSHQTMSLVRIRWLEDDFDHINVCSC